MSKSQGRLDYIWSPDFLEVKMLRRRCKNVYFTENVNLARIDYIIEHDGKYIRFHSYNMIKYCPFCGGIIKGGKK
jgi:hypothetical protein